MEAVPYKPLLVTAQLTGAQVLALSAKNIGQGGFLKVSGVSFTLNGGQVENVLVGGAPLDDTKTYGVAVIDYLGGIAPGGLTLWRALRARVTAPAPA